MWSIADVTSVTAGDRGDERRRLRRQRRYCSSRMRQRVIIHWPESVFPAGFIPPWHGTRTLWSLGQLFNATASLGLLPCRFASAREPYFLVSKMYDSTRIKEQWRSTSQGLEVGAGAERGEDRGHTQSAVDKRISPAVYRTLTTLCLINRTLVIFSNISNKSGPILIIFGTENHQ